MANELERWFGGNNMWNRIRDMSRFDESWDRFFNDLARVKPSEAMGKFEFSPSCEVSEEADHYVMKFDLPGVSKDQVQVQVNEGQLTVHAERKEEKKSEDKKKYLSEINYGSYTRSFTLPGHVSEKQVDAKFENGVLTISIPKVEASKSKQIPIH